MNHPLLQIEKVNKQFGGVAALDDVSLSIEAGEIYGLIGPNGAGKTTFFNVMTGLYTPDSERFQLDGQGYQPTAVHQVARAGIAHVPEYPPVQRHERPGKRHGRAPCAHP